MTVQTISRSQFCDLLGLDPDALLGVQMQPGSTTIGLILEGDMQTTGSFPQLAGGTKRKPKKPKTC